MSEWPIEFQKFKNLLESDWVKHEEFSGQGALERGDNRMKHIVTSRTCPVEGCERDLVYYRKVASRSKGKFYVNEAFYKSNWLGHFHSAHYKIESPQFLEMMVTIWKGYKSGNSD